MLGNSQVHREATEFEKKPLTKQVVQFSGQENKTDIYAASVQVFSLLCDGEHVIYTL